jgi:hypothetical protein
VSHQLSKISHFEACIGEKWMAWDASETIEIKFTGRVVTITQKLDGIVNTPTLKTIIDLDLVPAYASY